MLAAGLGIVRRSAGRGLAAAGCAWLWPPQPHLPGTSSPVWLDSVWRRLTQVLASFPSLCPLSPSIICLGPTVGVQVASSTPLPPCCPPSHHHLMMRVAAVPLFIT